jgi:TolB-like protein
MKKSIAIATLILFLFSTCATIKPYQVTNYFRSTKIEERQIKRIAVLPFENLTREPAAGDVVTDELNLQLGKLGVFDLVERAKIEELFREQDVDTLRFDMSTVVKIGKMLGAQAVILGSVTDFSPQPKFLPDTTRYHHHHPPVVIYDRPYYNHHEHDDNKENSGDLTTCLIVLGAITVVGLIVYLLVKPKSVSAEVGFSARLVDVETSEQLWQAKETFRGDRKSIQALVQTREEKSRLVSDIEFLNQILCREVAKTILK